MIFSLPPLSQQTLAYQPYLDYRLRVERRIDRDFASHANDNRTDAFNRFRAGISWNYGKRWSGDLQYQLAHNQIWKPTKISSDESSDLNLAYARYKDHKIDVTVGRQKISIGSERLIGSQEWAMTGRSFDGLRLKSGPWDAFAFRVGVAYPKPGRTEISGTSFTSSAGLTSLIFKHDRLPNPDTDHWTFSHLWQAKWNQLSAEGEGALQRGHIGGKDLESWAVHVQVGYAFTKATRAYAEINAASGGNTATTTRTFDNLLPSNHKFYGSMDLQGWMNMEEFALGVEHQFNPKWTAKGSFHSLSLRDASDAWYGAGGGPNQSSNGAFIDPTGLSGRDIGREIDLELGYKHNARISASAGVGLFFPGGFVRARNGGSADPQKWGYMMVQFRF